MVVVALSPVVWAPRWWNLAAMLLVPLFWLLRRRYTGSWSVHTPFDRPVLALLIVLPLTLLPVVQWNEAGPRYLALLYGLAVVYATANAPRQTQPVDAVLFLFFGSSVLVTAVGLVGTDWLTDKAIGSMSLFDAVYSRLPTLTLGLRGTDRGGIHPNQLAGLICLLAPLGAALAVSAPRWRRLTRLLLVLLVVLLLLTQSRSGFIGSTVGLAAVLGWWLVSEAPATARHRRSALWAILVLPVAGLAGWLVTVWTAPTTIGTLNTLPSRLELWDRAIRMIGDYPVTGIGMGQLPTVLTRLYPVFSLPLEYFVPHVHNFVLQLVLDLGIPGASAMLAIFGTAFWSLRRTYQSAVDRPLRGAAVGLASGVTGFLVYGSTDAIVFGARGLLPLWLVLGTIAWLACSRPEPAWDVVPRQTGSETRMRDK